MSLFLYFLRHGDAEEARAGQSDADRRLTDKGQKQTERVAEALARVGVHPAAIITSPLVRARQTAEIVARALAVPLVQDDRLACGASWQDVRAIVAERAPGAAPAAKPAVLFVGHEPDFGEIVSALIGGGEIDFKKSAVACVECAEVGPGAGVLCWYVIPKLWP
jgi:phosphohistidine phosphatase